MRLLPFTISFTATVALVLLLNHRWTIGGNRTPRLGYFLSPQTGFWQNAEPTNTNFSVNLKTPLLQDKVEVFFDDRLVPHVFAQNEHDVYFTQGYLHAKFRLWQMEFQTHAAAGRLSELTGRMRGDYSILDNRDREFRRLGMGWAAENSLKVMEADADTKAVMDAYTAGVNFYIHQLRPEDYPVEYKLLNYAPETWSNLKTALFLKYMSYDLASYEDDFEHTNSLAFLTKTQFEQVYPYGRDSLSPIIPAIPTKYIWEKPSIITPSIALKVPQNADSVYFTYHNDSLPMPGAKPDPNNGSNNWAVAGSKTASGRPILCGDPHLGLNMPSLWYEMQLHTPQWNAYGASFPGAAAIPIGFNDSIAWSETNAMRDVKDFFEITFKDDTEQEYLFNKQWMKTEWRIDTIKVLGEADYIDSIPMTILGPVMYDKRFKNPLQTGKAYAVRWKAHDGSNEAITFIKLARAKNYTDYVDAIKTFECPGQNFVFAGKSGDIAIWNQGAFPAKWRRQGDFVMPGTDSTYLWQGIIPQAENPHELNPIRGYTASANQLPVDTAYPYYMAGNFDLYRGITINRLLSGMTHIRPQDMQQMQLNTYNHFAFTAFPLLLKNLTDSGLTGSEKKYADSLRRWNCRNNPELTGPTIFIRLLNNLNRLIWMDEMLDHNPFPVAFPSSATMLEAVLKDSDFTFIDNIHTPQKETFSDELRLALKETSRQLDSISNITGGDISWGRMNNASVNHLLQITPFSRLHLGTGGGTNTINATNRGNGPSWRMVVHLTDTTEAYTVYPGGQSGNPGSRFYDMFVSTWATGKYYPVWMMTNAEKNDTRIKWKMQLSN